MHLPSPNQQRLIFAGKNLRTHVSLSLCQQCLIFAGKQLLDRHHLIFTSKRPKDALKARGGYVSPPARPTTPHLHRQTARGRVNRSGGYISLPPDQEHLIFAGKRLEDTLKAQRDVSPLPDQQRLIFTCNSSRMCQQLRGCISPPA
jgi:hypothetical protein